MTNKQIAQTFDLLGKIMELHDENPFKFRSYAKAFGVLKKIEQPLGEMEREDLLAIDGVGKNIADKIEELLATGELKTLNRYLDITPLGVQEMLGIKGFGPKKIRKVWQELEVTSADELLAAAQADRLSKLKGFGPKSQATLIDQVTYFIDSRGKYLHGQVIDGAETLLAACSAELPSEQFALVGGLRRNMPVVTGIDVLTTAGAEQVQGLSIAGLQWAEASSYAGWPVRWHFATAEEWGRAMLDATGPEAFATAVGGDGASEAAVFAAAGLPEILPELRDQPAVLERAKAGELRQDLIEVSDIKGIVHNHSTYSDGIHTLRQMAEYVRDQGFEYFVISDHSKTASYAGGLSEERVAMQQREIDELNAEMAPFKIYKSIESDILSDGSLDYSEEVLKSFDLVIASIHSGLRMTEEKAMMRLLRAIENPYTKILGHMTGRLLLTREAYPVDHKRIIDACAAHGVAIELNANPQRLDMDWEHIDYAIAQGVQIAINPDAHSRGAIHYIRHGVAAARKGGLRTEHCINTLDRAAFEAWMNA